MAAARRTRLRMERLEPVQSPRVCPRPRMPPVQRSRPARLQRMRHRVVRQARQMAVALAVTLAAAVTARQRPKSCREATTTLSPGGYVRQPSKKRIRPCARSCGRNTQTIVRAHRPGDDRWRFVSEAARAAGRELPTAGNTVRPFKVLARNWTCGTCDGREDCLGLGCRGHLSETGTCTALSSPMRS